MNELCKTSFMLQRGSDAKEWMAASWRLRMLNLRGNTKDVKARQVVGWPCVGCVQGEKWLRVT